MAAQKGRDFLLKLDGDGEGSFATIAGLRTHNFP
jgi:predicted secreted protein